MVGVEQWAEIRRMHRVERLSIREISKRTGLHRKTIRRALAAETPPEYCRAPAASKLIRFGTGSARSSARTPGLLVKRTFQRTVYRPGELVQWDLWEPREPLPVGHGQTPPPGPLRPSWCGT